MKSFVGILLTLAAAPMAVASQQYYDDYGEDAGGEYYQQQDYGGPDGGDYYAEDGARDTLYQDYAKHQEEKAMGGNRASLGNHSKSKRSVNKLTKPYNKAHYNLLYTENTEFV